MLLKTWTRCESALRSDEGASLVEYAILIGLIAVAAILVIGTVGERVTDNFERVRDSMPPATAPTP